MLIARAELGLVHHEQAEDAASQAVELAPANAVAHQVLASALLRRAYTGDLGTRRGVRDRALAEAREALRLAPGEVAALVVAAEAAVLGQHFAEATSYADQALQVAPDNVSARLVRATTAQVTGDLDVAEASARQALRLGPGITTHGALAFVLKDRGDDAGYHKHHNIALMSMFLGVARKPQGR